MNSQTIEPLEPFIDEPVRKVRAEDHPDFARSLNTANPVGDVLASINDAVQAPWREANRKGFEARWQQTGERNPYPEDTREHIAWEAGWLHAEDAIYDRGERYDDYD